jgi:endonuclease YncB( thermonuclease family)
MLRRPLIPIAIILALGLGFMLGYAARSANLDFGRVREVLRRLPIPKEMPRLRPTPAKSARATPEPETDEPAEAVDETSEREPGRVIRVVDGDTLHVEFRGRDETVRLLRINTPERNQPGFQESMDALAALVEDARIELEFEKPNRLERDRYGRLLAYVFRDDRHINVEMVRLGWSSFWTDYGEGRYADAFREAEQEARAARRGLWANEEAKATPKRPRRTPAKKP